ncbi:MAG: hypothetical protein E4H24_00135 [Thermomicrobiales bacterium]|jgi:nuclear transport factor 2 (NTF2) superfamily protein|nr:MAG: hypothetical protein E4H24_00135 [Thermomicrobiales bacterium]
MIHADVQLWLDRYVEAWTTYDPDTIGALFSEDASYRHVPYAEPLVGRAAIVASWLESKDEPGSWAAHYDVWALDGERATAIGESRYTNPDGAFKALYYNLWALRFDGHGQCVEFVDYFMELPERLHADH